MYERVNAVGAVLERLRVAANEVRAGWLPVVWRQEGPSGAELTMERRVLQDEPYGIFPDLRLEPGTTLALSTNLDLPAELFGVRTAGEPLELVLNSLYPIGVDVAGQEVFAGDRCPAAAGPALIEALSALDGATAPVLTLRIRTPDNQVFQIAPTHVPPWVWIRFTTPSLRARFEALDLAWARLHLASELAESDAQRAAVAETAARVPVNPHEADDADLAAIAAALAPMAEVIEAMTVHAVGHSHIDLAWLWRWDDTVEIVQRDVETVLELMDDFPEMCFTHSQPVTYEVVRSRRPDLFARLRTYIDERRWEPATAQWVESDTNLVLGESLARQLLEGVGYSREHLGRSPDVWLAPDTFGHAGNVPQLAAAAGVRVYYHHRCVPGDPEPWPAYWWEGADGSRVLGVTTTTYHGHITAGEVARAATRAHRAGQRVALHVYGVCDHGGGPTRQSLEARRRFAGAGLLPTVVCSTIAGYADDLLAGAPTLPTHRGESSLTFPGCYTSHCDSKVLNRAGEERLVTADTLAALAGLDADPAMTQAWRSHLFQQFHDILDGSSIAEVYRDQAAAAAQVEAIAATRCANALRALWNGLPTGSIAVTNPHGWERRDVVVVNGFAPGDGPVSLVDARGDVVAGQWTEDGLCFVATVPAFATVAYELRRGERVEEHGVSAEATPAAIRIALHSGELVFNPASGAVESWWHEGAELLGPEAALNVVQFVEEAPVPMSAWVLGDVRVEQDLQNAAQTQIVENGPVRTVVESTRMFRSSTISQRFVAYPELNRVDVEVVLDWREAGSSDVGIPGLKVAFRTGHFSSRAWYETPFAAARREPGHGEAPALRWAAIEDADGRGVAVLNDSRHAYDVDDTGTLRLRLIRSPYEPDPHADLGEHRTAYSIVAFASGWRKAAVARRAAGFGASLIAGVVPPTDHDSAPIASHCWRPTVAASRNVVIAGLKPAQAGGAVVVRGYESAGDTGELTLGSLAPGTAVHRATLLEDPLATIAVTSGAVTVRFAPFEVVTLLVQAPPEPDAASP